MAGTRGNVVLLQDLQAKDADLLSRQENVRCTSGGRKADDMGMLYPIKVLKGIRKRRWSYSHAYATR